MKVLHILFIIALALQLAACSHKIHPSATPSSPAATTPAPSPSGAPSPSSPTAPAPHAAATFRKPPDSLPALPVSEIDIPLKIYGRPLLARIDSTTPREFLSVGWPDYLQSGCDFRYKYRFIRSGLQITCTNNKFGIQFQGRYQIAGSKCLCAYNKPVSPWISGNCGFGDEPMRRVNIAMSSQLYILPDYRLRTTTKLEQLQALDKCTVSLFSSDVTQQILDSIRSSVNSFCGILDKTLAGMDFAPFAQQVTTATCRKTALAQYGYLLINPTALRVGRLNYNKDTFALSIGVSCRPLLTSDSSNTQLKAGLPPLQTTDSRDGLALYLNAYYEYSFLTRLMVDSLRNKVFTIRGRTIVVKDVGIRGIANHQVEIMIEFAGSNSGKVFLHGTPILDPDKQTLTIPDISYTVESRDLVIKIARSLFKNKIRQTLEGNSYLDIAAFVKTNQPMLDAQLNRRLAPDLFSTGKIKDIKLIGLLSQEKGLQIQLFVKANLSITSLGIPK